MTSGFSNHSEISESVDDVLRAQRLAVDRGRGPRDPYERARWLRSRRAAHVLTTITEDALLPPTSYLQHPEATAINQLIAKRQTKPQGLASDGGPPPPAPHNPDTCDHDGWCRACFTVFRIHALAELDRLYPSRIAA